jgi:anti-sigma regulatory factor (Ser/Thr protein kinase)
MGVHREVTLPAVPVSVRRVRETVAEIAVGLGAAPEIVENVRLCVSEAATNVVRHAYGHDGGDLRLDVDGRDGELTVVLQDDGVGLGSFRREGELGHGLRIMERLTNRFAVTSAPNAGTEVRMVFVLDACERERAHPTEEGG